jgi:tRNA threonylcarbamoyladenosine biosynthesis protein TsaE
MVKKFKVTEKVISKAISEILAIINSSSAIILLEGDLASGKTTFVKHFVEYFDIDEKVTSPTFSIQNIYGTNIYHYDIYQKSLEEFIQLGLFDMFSESGYHLVEWGDEKLAKLLKMYGFKFYHLKILSSNEKEFRIYQVSDQWQS